jgi:hypothetical protein
VFATMLRRHTRTAVDGDRECSSADFDSDEDAVARVSSPVGARR